MTKDEFLALTSTERRRLAAQRSNERRKARAAGKPVPPTLAEEFGVSPRKKGEKVEAVKAKPKKKAEKPEEKPKVERDADGKVIRRKPVYHARKGMGEPMLYTLGGFLNCWHQKDLPRYIAAAKKKGCKVVLPVELGPQKRRWMFAEEFAEENLNRVNCILTGAYGRVKLEDVKPISELENESSG